jgi:hypothetical protein
MTIRGVPALALLVVSTACSSSPASPSTEAAGSAMDARQTTITLPSATQAGVATLVVCPAQHTATCKLEQNKVTGPGTNPDNWYFVAVTQGATYTFGGSTEHKLADALYRLECVSCDLGNPVATYKPYLEFIAQGGKVTQWGVFQLITFFP